MGEWPVSTIGPCIPLGSLFVLESRVTLFAENILGGAGVAHVPRYGAGRQRARGTDVLASAGIVILANGYKSSRHICRGRPASRGGGAGCHVGRGLAGIE
jgi:hypothetical protein